MERIPVLKIGDTLLVSIQVDMHDQLALSLQDDLANAISRHHARGVIIDITALDIVDSFIGRTLAAIAKVAQIMDCQTVIVGMRPAVAITLVELGMTLPGIQTALDLEKGMQLLADRAAEVGVRRPPPADERLSAR